MKKFALLISALVLVLASCKKKEFPENITTEPEFFVKATIDGQPITLNAGTMGYYMFSNYTQGNDGMYSFIAEVKPQNCGANCPNSLRIELNDNQVTSQGANSNIAASIKPNIKYDYVNTSTVNPTIIGYAVTYSSSCNLPVSVYDWDFGFGPHSNIALPTHTYSSPGIYNTKLTVRTGTPPSDIHIENPIKVTTNPNAVRTRILVTSVINNSVTFGHVTSTGTSQSNYQFQWDFGDGTITSPDEVPSHEYQFSGKYEVILRVIDINHQDTAYHKYQVNTDFSNQPAPNFYVTSVQEILSNTPLAKIKITYTDGSGKVYSSDIQPQSGMDKDFQITSVEDYKTNENGQATKKLKIKFACRLYNSTSFVDIKNGEAVIAVAYK